MSKRRVFAIAAHPDDIEFVMAGTLLRLIDLGWEAHVLHVASGSCGSDRLDAGTIARRRSAEACAAAELAGAVYHPPLVADIEIFYERKLLAQVGALVREVAPEVVLTHAPSDYMEDHMNAGRLAVTAAFCRGMPNFPTDPPRHAVSGDVVIYHAQPHGNRDPLGDLVQPHFFVDVSSVIERKRAMLACHTSQREWLDVSQGMDSYLQTMQDLTAETGKLSGAFQYAEGWRRRLHYGCCAADADPLCVALNGLRTV